MSSLHRLGASDLDRLGVVIEEIRRHEYEGLTAFVREREANQVLHHFRGSEGYPAGGFVTQLMKTFARADRLNFQKLRSVYPRLGAAMALAMHYPEGLDRLREIAGGDGK